MEAVRQLRHGQHLRFLYLTLEAGYVVEVVPGQLVGQLLEHVSEDDRVHVLPQHVEEEPVAHLAPAHDQVDGVRPHQPVSHPEQVDAHPRREDDHHAVDHREEGQDGEDDEPEPEEDVDLLVHHV